MYIKGLQPLKHLRSKACLEKYATARHPRGGVCLNIVEALLPQASKSRYPGHEHRSAIMIGLARGVRLGFLRLGTFCRRPVGIIASG